MLVTSPLENDPRVYKEARIAHENGHEVTVICRTYTGEPRPYRVIPLNIARGANRIGKYWERLRINLAMIFHALRLRPKIIHANDLDTLPAGFAASLLTGAKLVYDAHELWSESSPDVGRFGKKVSIRLEKFVSKRASAVIAVSEPRAEAMVKNLGIRRPHVVMNMPFFEDTSSVSRGWRARYQDKIILIYQGLYIPGYPIADVIRMMHSLPENVVFLSRGIGEDEAALKELVVKENLSERVFILPPVPMLDMIKAATGADIGLIPLDPTRGENFRLGSPNKIYSYMMSGLAIVASDLPAIRPPVEAFDCGVLFEPNNVADMTRAVMALVTDPARLEAMKKRSLKAGTVYSWETEGQKLLKIYDEVVQKTD